MRLIKHIGIPGLVFIVVVCLALAFIYLLPSRPSECVFFLEAVNSGPPATGAYILDYLEDNENVSSLSDTRLFRVRGEGLEGKDVTLAVSGVQLAGDLTVKPDTHCTDYIVIKAFHNPDNPLPPPETLTINGETVRLFYVRYPSSKTLVAETVGVADSATLGGIVELWDDHDYDENGDIDEACYRLVNCGIFNTSHTQGVIPKIRITFYEEVVPGSYSVFIDDGDDNTSDEWEDITSYFQVDAGDSRIVECDLSILVKVGTYRIVGIPDAHPSDPDYLVGDLSLHAVADFLTYESFDDLIVTLFEDGVADIDPGDGNVYQAERNILSLSLYDGVLSYPINDISISDYLRLWNLKPVGQIRELDSLLVKTGDLDGQGLLDLAEDLNNDKTDQLVFSASVNPVGHALGEKMPTVRANASNEPEADNIDLAEVDRLIGELGSKDQEKAEKPQEREKAEKARDELIAIGRKSATHAEALAYHFIKRKRDVSSGMARYRIEVIMEELSNIPVERPVPEEFLADMEVSSWMPVSVRSFFLLDNQSDMNDVWLRVKDAQKVDFDKYFVLFCISGTKPSTGYSSRVVRIRRDFERERIVVYFKEKSPKGGGGLAITIPGDVVQIPKGKTAKRIYVVRATKKNLSDTWRFTPSCDDVIASFEPYGIEKIHVDHKTTDDDLSGLLRSDNHFIARYAVEELAKSEDKEFAIKALKESAFNYLENVWVRKAAIKALGTIDDKAVVPALSEFCDTIRTSPPSYVPERVWQMRVLYKTAINLLGDRPGLESLLVLLDERQKGAISGEGVREALKKALKKRQGEIEKIVKDPESIEADSKIKDEAMRVYRSFYGSKKAFPVLIDYARKSGSGWPLYIIKEFVPVDTKWKKPEEILQMAEKWYQENAPYIVGSTAPFYVDTDAKAAGVPVEIWRKIDSEKRGDWNKLTDEEKEKAIEVAEERLKKLEGK